MCACVCAFARARACVRNVGILREVSRSSQRHRHVHRLLQDSSLFPGEESRRESTKFVITALKFSLVALHLVSCLPATSESISSMDVC